MTAITSCLLSFVLWANSYHPNGIGFRMDPAETYATLAECKAAMAIQKADYLALEQRHKSGVLVAWQCLPDTIDPRAKP
jgi:hypothetical protein